MGDSLAQLQSPRDGPSYAPNSSDLSGSNIRSTPLTSPALGMPVAGIPQGSPNAPNPGSTAVHFGGRLPIPQIQYADDDGSEPRVDTRRGKERVMRRCSCGHSNHIRKNNCEKCDMPKPPPRKREKRPRRKKRSYLSSTGMAALSNSFATPFASYGSSHQQFIQPHLQSPVQQHAQFGQTQAPSYLPQISPLGQQRAQHHEFSMDRQDGPPGIIQEPEPNDMFRRNAQDYPVAVDGSAVPVLSGVHTTHSIGAPVSGSGYGKEDAGIVSSGFALSHSGDVHPGGHMLSSTPGNAGHDGNSQSVSPNMGGRPPTVGQDHGSQSIYQRMTNPSLSIEDIQHRPVHDQMRPPQGLAHTILSTPQSDGANAPNRDSTLGGALDIRGGGQGHNPVYTHGQSQTRYPFASQVLHSGAGGSTDGSHGLGADMQPFQHSNALSGVAEQRKLGVANPQHDSRADLDSSHRGPHSR